jgi:hypothetical protein
MQRPDTAKGRPLVLKDRPTGIAPDSAANSTLSQGPVSPVIVGSASDGGRKRRKRKRDARVLAAYASVYAPCHGRTRWWFVYVCPWCSLGHFGRTENESEIAGSRRTRCGKSIDLHIARVYRGRAPKAAA